MTARFSSSERPELPLEQACTRLPRVCSRLPPPGSPTRRTKAAASATRLGIPGEARAGDTSLNPGGQHRGIEVRSDRGGREAPNSVAPSSPALPTCLPALTGEQSRACAQCPDGTGPQSPGPQQAGCGGRGRDAQAAGRSQHAPQGSQRHVHRRARVVVQAVREPRPGRGGAGAAPDRSEPERAGW